jgi:hypothetical protein
MVAILSAFAKINENHVLASSYLHFSACLSSDPIESISVEVYIGKFFLSKISQNNQIWLKPDKNKGQFTRRPKRVFPNYLALSPTLFTREHWSFHGNVIMVNLFINFTAMYDVNRWRHDLTI